MYPCFDTDGISLEKLLREWKWLASGKLDLLAVNAFGDLFLQEEHESVRRLNVTSGTISVVAASGREFREAARDAAKKRE